MAGAHQRISEILGTAWESLRDGRPYPREEEIDITKLDAIWDSCFLIHVSKQDVSEKSYRYTYLGKSLIDAFGEDVTNEDISTHLIDPRHSPLMDDFNKVVTTGAPVASESAFSNRRSMVIKYRSCMYPLGDKHVEYIIGGMKWKAY